MEDSRKFRKQLEADFVVNRGSDGYYIQSGLSVAEPEKKKNETASMIRIRDSFKKIVVKDFLKAWRDDLGIVHAGIENFLRYEKHP